MTDRKDGLVVQLKGLFNELSGEDLSGADPGASFLDLGFDSLLLTQVSQAVQSRFGTKITFRQIMNELASLDALAGFLAEKVAPPSAAEVSATVAAAPPCASETPPEAKPASLMLPPQPTLAQPVLNVAANGTPTPGLASLPPADTGPLGRLVNQQLQVMAQQLEVLRSLSGNGVASPTLSLAASPAPAAAPPLAVPGPRRPVVKAIKHEEEGSRRFGPFKGIDKGPAGGLTPSQEKALAELVARYNRRTATSKKMAQEHRPHFCDPRAAGNFRQLWKEMVYPIVCARSLGSRIWDIDGNEYIDVTMGFGANYLGHSPDFVMQAVEQQMKAGVEIGPQSPLAGENARMICELTGMDRATFCNTGSEAVMAAFRVARTVTGRDKVVFFRGDYHGIFDEVLAKPALVDGLPGAMPIAPGVPHLANVIVLDYGDPASLEALKKHGSDIAAVVVEPVQARHPDLQPREFLHELRRVTEQAGIALIFDEVITGFRVAPGGAQEYFGVRADLATYGKVIGGGMPIGVLAGRARFMDALDGGQWRYGDDSFPEVGVTFFAGTFVRHPLAMAAVNAALKHVKAAGPALQQAVNERTARLAKEVNVLFDGRGLPMRLQPFSALFYYDFHPDLHLAGLLFYYLRDRGVHIWEGRVCHLSTAHTDQDIDIIVKAFGESVEEMQAAGFLPASGGAPPEKRPESDAVSPGATPVASGTREVFPLTEAQKEMWLAAQMESGASAAFNESTSIHFRGPFDESAMRRALQTVVERHEALRCTFSPDGSGMRFQPSLRFDVPSYDLSGLNQEERDRRVEQLTDQEGQRVFDLAQGPLLAAHILKLAPEEHILVFTAHHIACDGWSYDIVVRDLSALYSAFAEGKENPLAPPMQMSAYAQWEENQRKSAEAAECEAFWRSQFQTLPPPLDLPSWQPRPPVRTFEGARLVHLLPAELYRDLKRVGRQQGSTMFNLLQTAFAVLIHRLTGLDDLVLGVPAAGQNAVGSDSLVGHCANTLPLRLAIDPAGAFSALLRKNRDRVIDAYEHQNYTFGTLVDKLALPRDSSRIPLVPVTFNLDPPMDKVHFAGLEHWITLNPRHYFQFDLGFNLAGEGDTLRVECDFNSNLFDPQTVQRWLRHYQTLLQAIVADATQPVNRLALLDPSEQRQILREWNLTAREFPEGLCIHQLFERQAERTPDAVAIVAGQERLTYRELNRRAESLASALRRAGVGPDVLAGVCTERSAAMVVALLGILKAGGAYVPIDPAFPAERVAYMLEDSAVPVLLTERPLLSGLPAHNARVLCLDAASWEQDALVDARPQPSRPSNLAYVIYTSGSTGRPKGVQITHGAVVNFLESMKREPGITPDDVMLALTTLSFDIAALELFLPLTVGARLVILSHETAMDPRQLQAAMLENHATIVQATPSTWRMLLSAGWKGSPDLKVLCGGEAISTELADRLADCCRELWNMYGPTETTVWSTTRRIAKGEAPSIGRPIANTQVYVVDSELRPVPIGIPGELLIGGAGLARGYRNQPDLTAAKFPVCSFDSLPPARVYRTGDLARFLPDGQLQFLGRADHQVKIRGFRIELEEIEKRLASHPRVKQAVVVARADSSEQKELVAYIVSAGPAAAEPGSSSSPARQGPTNGDDALTAGHEASALTIANLRSWIGQALPEYMIPSAFVFLDKLPLTPNGKIDRRALPEPGDQAVGERREYLAPRNPREAQIAEIWSKVLGVKTVGVRDNFFELGGHSLKAVQLFIELEKAMSQPVRLPLATLFRAPTVEQLAVALETEMDPELRSSSLVPIQPNGTKPKFFCVHGAGGNVLLYRELATSLGGEYPFYGLQAQGLDGQGGFLTTIEAMAARYVKEVKQIQAHGPYCLGGYCMGGAIAYEMARQLSLGGETVALVALLDTYNVSQALQSSSGRILYQKVKFHFGNLSKLRPGEALKYVGEKFRLALDGELANLLNLHSDSPVESTGGQQTRPIDASIQAVNDAANLAYQPQPYLGRLTLFKTCVNYDAYPDPNLGWADLALGGLDVVELPVNPHAMLLQPYVQRLASEIRERLDAVERPAQAPAAAAEPRARQNEVLASV